MTTLTITIDDCTQTRLQQLSARGETDINDVAARLLRRAVLAARPRPVYDVERLNAYAAENEAEELALADSDPAHRAELLANEDGE